MPADHPAHEFKEVWNELATIDEEDDLLLVIIDRKVVVPLNAREGILKLLHLPHVGVTNIFTLNSAKSFNLYEVQVL